MVNKTILIAIAIVALVNSSVVCQSKQKEPFKSLFDGKTLNGWHMVGSTGVAEVIDGAIQVHMTPKTTRHTFVTSNKKYKNFILKLDIWRDTAFNSGVILRCIPILDTAFVDLYGYQIKIDPTLNRKWTGGIFEDYGKTWKWLYDLEADERAQNADKHGQWNYMRVEAYNDTIKVWLNDIPTTHLVNKAYSDAGWIALKIHALPRRPEQASLIGKFKNIKNIDKKVEKYLRPMDIPARISELSCILGYSLNFFHLKTSS